MATHEKKFKATIVYLQGGHSTFIAGLKPGEIEEIVSSAREQEQSFVFLHEPRATEVDGCFNKVAVDPQAVVALIAYFS